MISLFISFGSIQSLAAKDNFLIYNHEKHSFWLPANYLLNGTFDVIQNPYWFNQRNFSHKLGVVWDRVSNPHQSIKNDGGYGAFLRDEFFSIRAFPNFGLHFIGGAYDTLWLTEYFSSYNVPWPSMWAFLITYAAHFGNEALEASTKEVGSHDHIADLYFYDVAAFLLATFPRPMKFLIHDLGMKAWHFQPMWDVDGDDFFNTGLNYIFRPQFMGLLEGKLRPLLYLGMQTLMGASYSYKDISTISLAMGMILTDPIKVKGRFVTGIFHETEGELDASLFLNGSEDYLWRLNLYENLLRKFIKNKHPWNLSLMLGQAKGNRYAAGINIHFPFGIGGVKN